MEDVRLEGIVLNVTYRNDENGYTVLQIKAGRDKKTVVGILPELGDGESVVFTGGWITHQRYGEQFQAKSVEILRPTTLRAIEKYLSSGLIPGVGPATAERIVAHFGRDTLDIMEQQPQRLSEVKGISEKKALAIAMSYLEQIAIRQSMMFLQQYNIPASLSMKIARKYGERTPQVLRENPYRMVLEIDGVGFPTADRIALSMGIAADSEFRLQSGIIYTLRLAAVNGGHTCLPMEILLRDAAQLLHADEERIARCVAELHISARIRIFTGEEGTKMAALPQYLEAEKEIAERLFDLMNALPYRRDNSLPAAIERYERANGVTFSAQQQKAIRSAVEEGVLIVTGGPGTGKTTIIRCIISLLAPRGTVMLCAPTGRAAKRMSESTGMEAKTIHRLLEFGGEDGIFQKNQDDPLECDTMICDEMSMVDALLMRSLLRAVAPGTRLILVGDRDQLPSVGAGNVLGDILRSDTVPSVRLTEIFRQDENSMIVLNAHRINRGEMPELNGKKTDFFFERKTDFPSAAQAVTELVKTRLPKYMGWRPEDAARQIQVLSPTKKGDCGVWSLNTMLQSALNPPAPGKPELECGDTVFRLGDKVMQTENDYQMPWTQHGKSGEGVFNGDVGYVVAVDPSENALTVLFDDDRKATYEGSDKEALELAYCLSVHKSQGSEFPAVVMPVMGGPPMLLTRNLFYTALTRARSLVVLVGRQEAIAEMVNNNHVARRYTALAQCLEERMKWASKQC